MAKATKAPINPKVLRWAIETSGYEYEELASRLNLAIDSLNDWIHGINQPNLTQFKKLARLLNRPTAIFFLPSPPTSAIPQVEIRKAPSSDQNRLNKDEIRYLRESLRLQQLFSWVRKELGEGQVYIPKKAVNNNAEEFAHKERSRIGISISQQFSWSSSSEAFTAWRRTLEELGIFVFHFKMGKTSCRGFSLWDSFSPVIAVNTSWNVASVISALFHGYGHLMTKSNSVCASHASINSIDSEDPVEKWCESFSVSLLMPWYALSKFLHEQLNWSPGKKIKDLDAIGAVKRRFKVSLRAATLRLVGRKAGDRDLYSQITELTDKDEMEGGIGRNRLQIKLDSYGSSAFNLAIMAVNKDLISRTDALTFLDIADTDLSKVKNQQYAHITR
jgi:Zn-dependent peptidase ImmA (M78 family)/transcriptional regulator with XRE-family HTH domain